MGISQILSQDLQGIQEATSGKYLASFIALAMALGAVYSILTDTILTSPLELNPKINYLNAALIFLIAILTALVLTLTVYRLKKNWKENAGGKTGLLGSILAVFATACPICQPIWLVWLGLGSSSAFLVEYSTPIAVLSMALLLYSLHLAAQSVYAKTCKTQPKKK